MKRLIAYLMASLVVAGWNYGAVRAETLPVVSHLLIVALQTSQTNAVGNDFVEIYNPTADAIDVTGWKLQYRSATATGTATWTTKRVIACIPIATACAVVMPAGSHLVFSTYDLPAIEGEQPLASGFSDVGGQIRLAQPVDLSDTFVTQDLLGYGTAAEAEGGHPAGAPGADETLVRSLDANGSLVDTDDNAADFAVLGVGCFLSGGTVSSPVNNLCPTGTTPSGDVGSSTGETPGPPDEDAPPASEPDTPPAAEPPVGEETDPVDDPISELPADTEPEPATYLPLTITELLPDPASPLLDSDDEFIELYNPNSVAVNLAGYVLEAGSEFRYHFVLGNGVIAPGAYLAVKSQVSHLPLSNSGTGARLLDPLGQVVDEIASYGVAKEGQAWMKQSDGWHWTTTPTPGTPNKLTIPLPKATVATASKGGSTAKKKAATTSTKAKKTTSKVAGAGTGGVVADPTQPKTDSGLNYLFFASVGLLVVGYIIYEYRKNLARFGRRLWLGVTGKSKSTQQTG